MGAGDGCLQIVGCNGLFKMVARTTHIPFKSGERCTANDENAPTVERLLIGQRDRILPKPQE